MILALYSLPYQSRMIEANGTDCGGRRIARKKEINLLHQ